MSIDVELLDRLTRTPGIAGYEDEIRTVVAQALKPFVDDLQVDILGNLVGRKNQGVGKRLVITAHMDEIGFLVRHIDDNGFLRLQRVGGFDPRVLVAQRVLVTARNGQLLPGVIAPSITPVHLQKPGESRELRLEDMFVDLGMAGEAVREQVSVGAMVTLDRSLAQIGDTLVSKALDDRLGLYAMIEAMRRSTATDVEIVVIATTQEEVGLRGAQASAFTVDADVVIALDVTIAGDIPGTSDELRITKLGQGTAIKLIDSSQISNRHVVRHLQDLAIEHGIAFQLELLPAGGNDGSAFQRSRSGAAVATISIPTRYVHTVNEMAHVADIEATIDLLTRFIDSAAMRDYRYVLDI